MDRIAILIVYSNLAIIYSCQTQHSELAGLAVLQRENSYGENSYTNSSFESSNHIFLPNTSFRTSRYSSSTKGKIDMDRIERV